MQSHSCLQSCPFGTHTGSRVAISALLLVFTCVLHVGTLVPTQTHKLMYCFTAISFGEIGSQPQLLCIQHSTANSNSQSTEHVSCVAIKGNGGTRTCQRKSRRNNSSWLGRMSETRNRQHMRELVIARYSCPAFAVLQTSKLVLRYTILLQIRFSHVRPSHEATGSDHTFCYVGIKARTSLVKRRQYYLSWSMSCPHFVILDIETCNSRYNTRSTIYRRRQ